MSGDRRPEWARRPQDLGRLFLERANSGDIEGVVALYEPEAVLALPNGEVARGAEAIHRTTSGCSPTAPAFTAVEQRAALVNGELALTSTRLAGGGVTAEVARRQPNGTWLWAADQANLLASQIDPFS